MMMQSADYTILSALQKRTGARAGEGVGGLQAAGRQVK